MGLAWYVPFPKSPACWAKDPFSLSLSLMSHDHSKCPKTELD